MTHKLCQNANLENGGTTIRIGIMDVLLLFVFLLFFCFLFFCFFNVFTVEGTGHVQLFRDAKRVVISFYVVKKINEMQVAG